MVGPDRTPSFVEDEIVFTRSALLADPNTADLLPLTDGWIVGVDDAYAARRDVSTLESESSAQRSVADAYLTAEVMAFARGLGFAVQGDLQHPRYLGFFPMPASQVVKESRSALVSRVKGWLLNREDEVLEQHREALASWSAKLEQCLLALDVLLVQRQKRDESYRAFCEKLTTERDLLHGALRERACERDLERTWPNRFFKLTRKK